MVVWAEAVFVLGLLGSNRSSCSSHPKSPVLDLSANHCPKASGTTQSVWLKNERGSDRYWPPLFRAPRWCPQFPSQSPPVSPSSSPHARKREGHEAESVSGEAGVGVGGVLACPAAVGPGSPNNKRGRTKALFAARTSHAKRRSLFPVPSISSDHFLQFPDDPIHHRLRQPAL